MSAIYWSRHVKPNARLADCPTTVEFMHLCRIYANVHWKWDEDSDCYQTHRWTSDARYHDVRSWPSETALSSFLRAVREDDRINSDPLLRLMAAYITLEYLTKLLEEKA